MPPRKRDKPIDVAKPQRTEQAHTDHELFLQAFEKPTQIYRYLRARHLALPIFMHRTLTYMKHRMSRTHKARRGFRVDNMLSNMQAQHGRPSSQLVLNFTGFFDKSHKKDTVIVEAVILLKICTRKRSDPPTIQVSAGRCEVARNPEGGGGNTRGGSKGGSPDSIVLPESSFHPITSGVKSYVLLLRVVPNSSPKNHDCGRGIDHAEEPSAKKARRGSSATWQEEEGPFAGEMVVYDEQQRCCLLLDGQYELALRPWSPNSHHSTINSSWETMPQGMASFEAFEKGPKVAFRLHWGQSPENSAHTNNGRRVALSPVEMNAAPNNLSKHFRNRRNGSLKHSDEPIPRAPIPGTEQRTRVFYQFQYGSHARQQTEARADMRCPWCLLDCRLLTALLKHLKLCHNRFTFAYVPLPKGARIDVSLNECYDGSYAGNPQYLHPQTSHAWGRWGPVRRTPITYVMVCRPKRSPLSLSEFLEPDEPDVDQPRPYISGHNRLYYHTATCLPLRPQEIDRDSEAEDDPDWLKLKTQLMIDEFTDVNEGEKELMKMWNLHVMKYGFVGDCQIAIACNMFVEQHGRELIGRNLYRNFVLHMCNLLDFGLVSASVVYTTVRRLQMFCHVKDRKFTLPSAYT
ncbi:polycomb protein suz12-like [Ornithodoros turicata]|uniref:polycomb protein suz12-like n=1 Tax=Ornithodoros turicata TaxID=34597 RepID=UPI0031398F27